MTITTTMSLHYSTPVLHFKRDFKVLVGLTSASVVNNNNNYSAVVHIVKKKVEINLSLPQWQQLQQKFGEILHYFGRMNRKDQDKNVTLIEDNNVFLYLRHHQNRKLLTLKETTTPNSSIKEINLNKKQIMSIIQNAWLINNYLHNLMLLISLENTLVITNEVNNQSVNEDNDGSDKCVFSLQ